MSRKPDYTINAMNKDTDEKGRIGAAWKNDDGSISLADTWGANPARSRNRLYNVPLSCAASCHLNTIKSML